MSSPSRTAQFTKVHKVLKKAYKPVIPDGNRSVLEHLLFACCLENAHYDVAEEAFAALVHNFFDWNEVRVTTVRELSEVTARLPEPAAAANRVKHVLQGVFEASYSFDLEELRKMNLGPATEKLTKMKGTTPFTVAYVVQAALGGHSIPLDAGTLGALRVLDLVTDEDVQNSAVPGLERAIPKTKGSEFGSLLHQLGADFVANPYAPSLHEILLEINPDARDRLPKRRKPSETIAPEEKADATAAKPDGAAPEAGDAKAEAKAKRAPGKKKPETGKGKAAKAGTEKAPESKAAERKKETPPAAERKKAGAEKKDAAKKKAAKKEPAPKKKDAAEKPKPPAESGKKEAGKEPGSGGLAKRKPR